MSKPTCIYGNTVHSVCMNPNCKRPAIICEKGITQNNQCALFHDSCQKMEWNQFQSVINENPNTKNQQFDQLVKKMEDLFLVMIRRIQAQHANFKLWVKTFGYSAQAMKVFKTLLDRQFDSISGSDLNMIFNARFAKEKKIEIPNLSDADFKEISYGVEHTFDKITGFYLGRRQSKLGGSYIPLSPKLDSKIIEDLSVINTFFENSTIKKASLLFRASEHNFSTASFHKVCDNANNTLVLIKTQFDKIIGGFTPLHWNSSSKHWAQDKSMKSFIFSVTMKEKFQLNLSQFAIACNPQKGPIFGCCDLCIFDRADQQKSNAQFPISYNNGKYTRGQNTYTAFTGHPKGQFLTKEWEVFKIEF